jgi:tyrosyl-tRNA synthetase
MKLAYEIVKMYHSEKDAQKAEEYFVSAFTKREVPEDILEVSAKKGSALVDVLLENKIVSSKSDFRRLVEGGAVDVSGERIDDAKYKVDKNISVRVGKKKFIKINI